MLRGMLEKGYPVAISKVCRTLAGMPITIEVPGFLT